MKKLSVKEVQDLMSGMAVMRSRRNAINELCKKESRVMNEAEALEFEQISRDLRVHQDKLEAWKSEQAPLSRQEIKAAEAIADVVRNYVQGRAVDAQGLRMETNTIYLERAEAITGSADVNAIQPDSIHELLEPLQKALIVDKLGIKMNTNIVGTRKYPSVNNITASIEGETTKLVGQAIKFQATNAAPKRIGVSVPFSLLSLHQANIDLIAYAIRLMNMAAAQVINSVMFSTSKLTDLAPEGCFVEAAKTPVFTKTTDPLTEGDLIDLEIAVMDKELPIDATAAYVCGVKSYGQLKKMRDPMSGERIYQNGQVNGYPVFVTNHMPATGLGFGVFSQSELNQYGAVSVVIDNLSRSSEAITEINFNMFFDVEVVRKEAFAYGTFTKALTTITPVTNVTTA